MQGDYYIGRGSRERNLKASVFGNPFKVAVYGRAGAIRRYEAMLRKDDDLLKRLPQLSGSRLVCHCRADQACHADSIIAVYKETFPLAYDRNNTTAAAAPSAEVLNRLAQQREVPESDDGSTADEGAPGRGSGWVGTCKPMQIGSGYTRRDICDGQSLASPGRWAVEHRTYPDDETWRSVSSLYTDFSRRVGTPALLTSLALGKVSECPFSPDSIQSLKQSIVKNLASRGLNLDRQVGDREDVPIDFRYLDLLLRASRDPEVALGSFAKGVRVGPGARLPRLPALYRPKRKWKLADQGDPDDYREEELAGDPLWKKNYPTLAALSDKVKDVLDDQSERGQVLKLSEREARIQYPDLVVAALGANKKEKPNGIISARVLFDGSNGIAVNRRTRIRDQERSPVAADLKRVMREKARLGQRTFALTADVAEAHRQIPIHPRDWHLLGCQIEAGGDVYINKVGTFGVASASYYWSRAASALGRLTQYITGRTANTWHQLVADDFHLEASGTEYRTALISFFVLCATAGVPLSWGKTAGGDKVTWVGFELLHHTYHLGISERRAAWFVKWAEEVASSDSINTASFEEGLGRLMYVAGALEYERPFLSPLYSFLSLHPRGAVRKVPAYVKHFLRYLARQVSQSRHYNCATTMRPWDTAPRVDAQASEGRTGIGGWAPELDEDGRPDPWRSRWYSHEITKEEWPWIFERGEKPARVISTLEALAVLMGLKLFYGDEAQGAHARIQMIPSFTDNRGNGSALNKLMSNKYPSSAVVMELACYLKRMGIKAVVDWAPRTANYEADELANGNTSRFDPSKRLFFKASDVLWDILPEALQRGREMESECQRALAGGRVRPDRTRKQKKRKLEDRLRVKDPW